MRIALISMAALAALAAYVWADPLFLSNPPKALIIDGWWQRDHARNACKLNGREGDCSEETIGRQEYTYSGELLAQFSANKNCSTVVLRYFARPDGSDQEMLRFWSGPHMTPMVDYVTGPDDQWWSIAGRHQNGDSYQAGVGHGTPKEIAETVCAIVANPGAWE